MSSVSHRDGVGHHFLHGTLYLRLFRNRISIHLPPLVSVGQSDRQQLTQAPSKFNIPRFPADSL